MITNALGLIEVIGFPTAVEAADTCVKSANVRLIGYELATDGLIAVKVTGDVGAVKAAVEAAKISAGAIGKVLSTLVISRPAEGIGALIESGDTVMGEAAAIEQAEPGTPPDVASAEPEQLDKPSPDASQGGLGGPDMTVPEPEPETDAVAAPSLAEDLPDDLGEKPKGKATCNICHDPLCPRQKGQPGKLCIHIRDSKNSKGGLT